MVNWEQILILTEPQGGQRKRDKDRLLLVVEHYFLQNEDGGGEEA